MKANDAGKRSSARRDPSCSRNPLDPHSGKEAKSIGRLDSTLDVIYIVENEVDISVCIGTCSESPQYPEEARQRCNG